MAHIVAAPPDGSDVGEVIRWYRKHHDMTQEAAAKVLNTTQSRLSKLEKGALSLSLDELRLVATKFGIPPERLGVLPDRSFEAVPNPKTVSDSPGAGQASQECWKSVRATLNKNRAALGEMASELYPQANRIPNTSVLTKSGWLPSEPVELGNVNLQWQLDSPPKPFVTGQGPETELVRPLAADGERYRKYSSALRDLTRPKLLDNRVSYRLLGANWEDGRGQFEFGYTSYFDVRGGRVGRPLSGGPDGGLRRVPRRWSVRQPGAHREDSRLRAAVGGTPSGIPWERIGNSHPYGAGF